MTGMEGMVKTLLRSMGFDPQQFIDGMQGFINRVVHSLAAFDATLKSMDGKLDAIRDHLDYIKPMMQRPTCGIDDSMAPVIIDVSTASIDQPPEERKAA